ncbi:MAG: hypothetical protein A3C70_01015 [Candidatus Zambryskibacteria bacterium RIFCSPHIGHO2_02_FULL_43_14]|uniref:Toxin YoeB n=1 Tax=Candidatus Zambryskibacteria bacterium RIFCSPHIGHO2_02_FULL_43_14 TaxID=1802748 RepID=A0A1G2TFC5_9BACT|nr:MAG: hypothetical protein A2829_00815 [Candidatus Zambryskibacteria bacterium RIFCSPHIGHO2_01_FULL_43_60]OHA95987.1 MAG: hypothetical protein A3C70_01015 [Candidatus Zambryskibacteria bacterium RIFCSPHIGHO2_02_FULL_43_14]OHB03127.1 MAG: hypothetical protein A3B03_01655 [Candidatus Zambryskibacteria bacterium RIFCSPLOWO2_01_FULL_42_41]
MRIVTAVEFDKRYNKLPVSIQKKAEKQEKIFRSNPFHPSLHTEKLEPKNKELWSVRIDKSYRIIFRFMEGNTVLFLTVGPHDWIYKLKF